MDKIVVGVDGSGSSRQALAWAANEAEVGGGEVLVVESWHDPVLGGSGASALHEIEVISDEAKHDLESILEGVREAHPSVHFSSILTDSRPAAAIVKAADDADLVVVGARGRGGFLGLELGSVSAKVARRSPVPIAVVRGEHDRGDQRTVVVGVDGSDCSRRALSWAADWAKAHDKELHIVLAWNYLEPQGLHGPEPMQPDYTADDAVAALDAIAAEVLGSRANPRVTREAVCDLPARAIIERADGACLVVLGRHGATHWSPPDFDATALQVLHHAACPVAIVPEMPGRSAEPAP